MYERYVVESILASLEKFQERDNGCIIANPQLDY